MLGGVPADHLGDDVEQLTGHGDDTFAVALGRADHQQSDDLAVGALVVADAQVGQFAEFFDAQARARRSVSTIAHCQKAASSSSEIRTSSPPVRLSTRIGGFGCSGSARVAMRCQVVPSTSKQWPVSTVRAVSRRMRKLVQRSLTCWERIGRSGCRSRVRLAMRSDSRRRRMWNWRTSVSRIGLGATQRAQRSGSAADQVCRSR